MASRKHSLSTPPTLGVVDCQRRNRYRDGGPWVILAQDHTSGREYEPGLGRRKDEMPIVEAMTIEPVHETNLYCGDSVEFGRDLCGEVTAVTITADKDADLGGRVPAQVVEEATNKPGISECITVNPNRIVGTGEQVSKPLHGVRARRRPPRTLDTDLVHEL
jgi:hypothetical protein